MKTNELRLIEVLLLKFTYLFEIEVLELGREPPDGSPDQFRLNLVSDEEVTRYNEIFETFALTPLGLSKAKLVKLRSTPEVFRFTFKSNELLYVLILTNFVELEELFTAIP